MPLRRPTSRSAFTLVETIAALTVVAVVGLAASGITLAAVASWRDAAVSAAVHAELSTAMERIAKELRAVEPHPTVAGAPRIASITPASISFNAGASITLSGGRVFLDPGPGATDALLSGVTSLSIQAFDQSGTLLPGSVSGPACQAVRRLQIAITVQRQGITHSLRTRFFIRGTMAGASS